MTIECNICESTAELTAFKSGYVCQHCISLIKEAELIDDNYEGNKY